MPGTIMPKGEHTREIKKWVDLPDGTRQRRSFYGRTPEEALEKWRAVQFPAMAPEFPPGTFGWWMVAKWAPLKAHLEANTHSNYQFAARHLLPELGTIPIRAIDATALALALNRIASKRKTIRKRLKDGRTVEVDAGEYSASSINRCRSIALEVVELASETDPLVKRINPRRVKPRKAVRTKIVPYSPQEMRVLLNVCRNTIGEAPVILGGFLGLTLNEARACLAGDLTRDGHLEAYHHQKRTGERGRRMKTDYRPRSLPLPDEIHRELKRLATTRMVKLADASESDIGAPVYFERADAAKRNRDGKPLGTVVEIVDHRRVRIALPEDPKRPLCQNTKGMLVDEGLIDRCIYPKMKRAGLRRMTFHQLRHCFSSWLEDEGCPATVRLEILGQSTEAVRHRYNHPLDAKKREWIGRFWEHSKLPLETPLTPDVGRPGPRTPATGAGNGRSKLTETDVRAIRALLARGLSPESIAKIFPVDPKAIRQIRDGATWKGVA